MESNIIKALPSWYKGIQFRSRLEARWAYYFDLLGLPWVYEPEAYSLPSGNYLPDFFLSTKHRKNVFVEVKSVGWMDRGVGVNVNGPDFEAEKRMEYDTARHNELVQATGTDLVRLVGPPKGDAWYWINCYLLNLYSSFLFNKLITSLTERLFLTNVFFNDFICFWIIGLISLSIFSVWSFVIKSSEEDFFDKTLST